MGQAIPGQDSEDGLASVSTNPTPQQDDVPESQSPGASPGSRPADEILAISEQEFRKREPRKVCRTDSGKLHRVRHGILSREALDALVRIGEDRRTLRRPEKQYRTALRPIGPFGNLFFDRFWSSYLRLLLGGRLQTQLFAGKSVSKSKPESLALVPGHQPTLVRQDPDGQPVEAIRLNDEMLDLDKPVAIEFNGRTAFTGMVWRTAALLSKTLDEREDPRLVFAAEIEVR